MRLLILCLLVGKVAFGKIILPEVIGDHMVLQQRSTVLLWGWGAPGEKVSIYTSWSHRTVRVSADGEGIWRVRVRTGKAGGPYSIEFTASNHLRVSDILLGEVWVASGGSNMEFTMAPGGARPGVVDFQKEIGEARYPAIRMIDVRHTVADTPVMGVSGQWKVCSPATAGQFSAVAYYFARKIYEERGVPVGIINSSFGGTPIEAWMKRAVLERDTGFRRLLDRYAEEGVRYPDRHREYLIKMDRWHRDTSANRGRAPAAPPGPKSSFSPGKLYNGMIAPLLNVNIAGVIWYQGEASGRDAELYRRLFPALIRSWRGDFKKGRLPFYFVEIGVTSGGGAAAGGGATVSGNRAASGAGATSGGGPSSGAGALLVRDAQRKTFREVPHMGIVVVGDTGDAYELRNKKPIGEGLARWALGK